MSSYEKLPPLRVLLVENHEQTARAMIGVLKAGASEVLWAATAKEAFELAETRQLDIIVSDIGLPDQSGHELMAKLREAGIQTPAIAVSGLGFEHTRAKSLSVGFATHLTKPLTGGQVRDAIVKTLCP